METLYDFYENARQCARTPEALKEGLQEGRNYTTHSRSIRQRGNIQYVRSLTIQGGSKAKLGCDVSSTFHEVLTVRSQSICYRTAKKISEAPKLRPFVINFRPIKRN
ncbi:unnamed protein product [Sphagnum jensenii]|uniref:Uncharacterized protein n=1 Tax=Sphagnum jensenii TaxID=128206 RepID=A0ABP1BWI3_9BRYO